MNSLFPYAGIQIGRLPVKAVNRPFDYFCNSSHLDTADRTLVPEPKSEIVARRPGIGA